MVLFYLYNLIKPILSLDDFQGPNMPPNLRFEERSKYSIDFKIDREKRKLFWFLFNKSLAAT